MPENTNVLPDIFESTLDRMSKRPLPADDMSLLNELHIDAQEAVLFSSYRPFDEKIKELATCRVRLINKNPQFWTKALQYNPFIVTIMLDPALELVRYAVNIEPRIIWLLENPDPAVILTAIKRRPHVVTKNISDTRNVVRSCETRSIPLGKYSIYDMETIQTSCSYPSK